MIFKQQPLPVEGEGGRNPKSKKPSWLKVRIAGGPGYLSVRRRLDQYGLHTVCENAKCPNIGECWARGAAAFLILGRVCTRRCGFCATETGCPSPPDPHEPARLAEAVRQMALDHVVITSVTRDDLPDGGASVWAATIYAVRQAVAHCEALTPDFKGSEASLHAVLDAKPDILNHNIETVSRLYPQVRPQAVYDRSLQLLDRAKARGLITKSGLMLGMGETEGEIRQVLRDLRAVHVDILTLGQYLRPTPAHWPVARYVTPNKFATWKQQALRMDFKAVEAGPLVRSSYRAGEQAALFLT